MKLNQSRVVRMGFSLLLAMAAGVPAGRGQPCPTIVPQVKQGSASRCKVGMVPCEGECPLHYYLSHSTGSGVEYSGVHTFPPDNWNVTYQAISGTTMSVDPHINSLGQPFSGCASNGSPMTYTATTNFAKATYIGYYRGALRSDSCIVVDGTETPSGCDPYYQSTNMCRALLITH